MQVDYKFVKMKKLEKENERLRVRIAELLKTIADKENITIEELKKVREYCAENKCFTEITDKDKYLNDFCGDLIFYIDKRLKILGGDNG